MEIGNEWTGLNLGVMLRQVRPAAWTFPGTLSGEIAFGLCEGTAQPYGTAEPRNFIGVRTKPVWQRLGNRNWWQVGWEVFSVLGGEEYSHGSGTIGTLRVSEREDLFSSAWYARFRRTSGGIVVDVFLPTGTAANPTENDLISQTDLETWNTSVNNHTGYEQHQVETWRDGPFDSVNIFSDVPNYVSEQLRGVEFLAVRALRLD